jgi:hypothetical protein
MMGFAKLVIGPAEGGTRWLNPSYSRAAMNHHKTPPRTLAFSCCSAALALGICAAQAAGQSIDSAYTGYDTKACPHRAGRDAQDYGEWHCKGLGMAVLVSAGDQRMTVSFGPHAKDEPAAGQTLQGFNDAYKARIEWRDTPDKAVKGQVLVVTRLGPGGVCHVGYVDALANANANALARTIADERARTFDCANDMPIILGATGPGFSSSSGAEKVDGLSTR